MPQMRILIGLALVAGAIAGALLSEPQGLQVASVDAMPRQMSQIGR